MNGISVHVPSLALDPATRSTLVQTIVDTLPHIPDASDVERAAQRDSAFALLAVLDPRDPLQAMYTLDAIAANSAGAHAYRCAARPDLPLALALRFQKMGWALARLKDTKIRELRRLQAASERPASVASVDGPRAPQAPAVASGATERQAAPVRPSAPVARPEGAAAGQRPGGAAAVGSEADATAGTGDAGADRLLAELAARMAEVDVALAA